MFDDTEHKEHDKSEIEEWKFQYLITFLSVIKFFNTLLTTKILKKILKTFYAYSTRND